MFIISGFELYSRSVPLQNSFVKNEKSNFFPRFARLCYCGKQQKSLSLVKKLACTCHKKRQFSLEALLACIRGRLGCKYISLTM